MLPLSTRCDFHNSLSWDSISVYLATCVYICVYPYVVLLLAIVHESGHVTKNIANVACRSDNSDKCITLYARWEVSEEISQCLYKHLHLNWDSLCIDVCDVMEVIPQTGMCSLCDV